MNKNINLKDFGLNDDFLAMAESYENLYAGRVISQHKNSYDIISQEGYVTAETSGKFKYNALSNLDMPCVGDFVMIDRVSDKNGKAVIHCVLERKSAFVRKAAGPAAYPQIVASNIDTVFICMSLNDNFNIRRLERYISIAYSSGAVPAVILTKSDLCPDVEKKVSEAHIFGVDIIVTSNINNDCLASLEKYIRKGETVAFIGSSGVGKSTLINMLIGKNIFKTNELRNDDQGRHTTTHRELIMLENGGMVIDTPGMRELGIESADVSKAFSDIDELVLECRFSNCSHTNEPGCAVQDAISKGTLSSKRYESYEKLKNESRYDGLNAKQIEEEKIKRMFGGTKQMKNFQKALKNKNKFK